MSFLSIAFLAALPLAAAPLLLHLFDRRRNVVIEWGAMQFLMEAATRRRSTRWLKQWLLLALRVFALLALILALARPLLPGNWFGAGERGETILIIDNSMSMTRAADRKTLFDQAVDRAVKAVDELPTGDFARILVASPYPVWLTPGGTRIDSTSRSLLQEQLRELRPTAGQSDLLSALFTAVQAERDLMQQRRQILLLTDGQAADWALRNEGGWSHLRQVLQEAALPTNLVIVELAPPPDPVRNLAITAMRAHRTVVGVNQIVKLTAEVKNVGQAALPPSTAQWTVDGEAKYDSQVPGLDSSGAQDLVWRHSFERPGTYAVTCRVDVDDALAPDNESTVIVQVVESLPVAVVENHQGLAEMQRDAFFVQAALGRLDEETDGEVSVFAPRLVDQEELPYFDFSTVRAVVIPNLNVIDAEAVERLQEFVFSGGGLWIGLGPRTDTEAFNLRLYDDGKGLAPLPIDAMVDHQVNGTDEKPLPAMIHPFLESHPATVELADHEQLDLAAVRVTRRYRFLPGEESESVAGLLRMDDGDILLAEKSFGDGRVFIQGIPLRLQWSDLARSRAFVVLIHDTLEYLVSPSLPRHNLQPGDPIVATVVDAETRDATLRTPHGDAIELTGDDGADGVVFRSSRTRLPGRYSLETGLTGDALPFYVSRSAEESELRMLARADRERVADLAGLTVGGRAGTTLRATNQQEPLWPLLLAALVVVITAELLLAGMMARERFGDEPAEAEPQFVGLRIASPQAALASEARSTSKTSSPASLSAAASSERN